MAGITHGNRLVRSAADVTADMSGAAGFSANSAARAKMNIRDRGTDDEQDNGAGKQGGTVAAGGVCAVAGCYGLRRSAGKRQSRRLRRRPARSIFVCRLLTTAAPPVSRAPSDNGLPPVAPGERLGAAADPDTRAHPATGGADAACDDDSRDSGAARRAAKHQLRAAPRVRHRAPPIRRSRLSLTPRDTAAPTAGRSR